MSSPVTSSAVREFGFWTKLGVILIGIGLVFIIFGVSMHFQIPRLFYSTVISTGGVCGMASNSSCFRLYQEGMWDTISSGTYMAFVGTIIFVLGNLLKNRRKETLLARIALD